MNTIKLLLIIAILLSIGQTSKAQYSLMLKGQRCPFDSAVAIHIDTYRLESKKLNLADTIISNLKHQLLVKDELNLVLQNKVNIHIQMLELKDSQLADKDKTIELLHRYYKKPKEPTWWDSNINIVLFSGGFVLGGSLLYILLK